jgi:tetratricopeptide (TPR) repeat protein
LNQLGDDEKAMKEFSSFQPDDPLYELARFQMAGIYFEHGTKEEKEKGYQILEELRKRGKAMKDVYLVLGSGYREDYRLEEAKEVLNEGFTYYSDDVEMGLIYGAVLEELGDVNGAIEVVKKLLEIQPENPDVLNFLGYTYLEYDMDIKEAERMIKKAYEKSQEGYITDSIGFLYYKKGELKKALHYINMAIEKSPDDGEIWEHLGDVYLKMGNLKKAREAYSTALTKKLREKQRKRIEEKLKALESTHNK